MTKTKKTKSKVVKKTLSKTDKLYDKMFKLLVSLEDEHVNFLAHSLELAFLIRNSQKRFMLNNDFVAKALGVTPEVLAKMKNGAYEFDVRMMAKIDTMIHEQVAGSFEIKIPIDFERHVKNAIKVDEEKK